MTVLSIHSLSVNTSGRCLLKDINLHIKAGQILTIIGPNGAGKTTLLNAIRGSIKADLGHVIFCGKDIHQWSVAEQARCLAMLPQQNLLNFPFTVQEVVSLGRIPHASGAKVDHEIVQQVAQMFDMTHLLARLYTRLSGGEKQRVQLARVMAQIWRAEEAKQRVLLLDEPTTALDLGHQRQLMQLITQFASQGVAVIMVMHDIDLAASYADMIIALKSGRTVALGSVDQVIVPEVLKTLFDIDIGVLQHPKTGRPVLLKS